MRSRTLSLAIIPLCLMTARAAHGQGALNPPAPLTPAVSPAAVSEGRSVLTHTAAQRAQELGFPSLAAGIYRELLAAAKMEPEQSALTLALAAALLDDGQPAEAEKVLAGFNGARGSAWHLRMGLAAVQLKKVEAARAEMAAIRLEDLTPADRAWTAFFQGTLYDLAPVQETTKANESYVRGEQSAPNEMARARFKLAAEQLRLGLGSPNEATVRQSRLNYEANRGRGVGYSYAENYAVTLAQAGKKADATTFLRDILLTLPPQERAWADRDRLLLGLIADTAPGDPGRVALNQLLATGSDPERQRVALQLLASKSQDAVLRGVYRAELTKLIDTPTKHPILESLLLFRAQVALAEKNYGQAEEDAKWLLDNFPGSRLRTQALGVLTGVAWELARY
ncbi:MAG: hypothetical protein NTV51_28675, partial [Verrucomicrobia bacterium]|nr:hypothetical protein [Verrucomicrobiota bacterium]